MEKYTKTIDCSAELQPCRVMMITDRGLRSLFHSCDAVIKDHRVYAYRENDGQGELDPFINSNFFAENNQDYLFYDEVDPGQLLHFEAAGKWGLFRIADGAIVIKPEWDFIARIDTNYIHVAKKTEKTMRFDPACEGDELDALLSELISSVDINSVETGDSLEDDCIEEDWTIEELPWQPASDSLFDEDGELNFTDYYEYLQYLDGANFKHGVIDRNSQVVIPVEYDYLLETLLNGETYFEVQKNRKMGLLTAENTFVIPLIWDDMGIISDLYTKDEKMIIVSCDQKFGVINLDSQVIIPMIYDKVELAQIEKAVYFKVTADGKEGIVNQNNEPLIPISWDRIEPVSFLYPQMDTEMLWQGALEVMIGYQKAPQFISLAEAILDGGAEAYKLAIYNRRFELICPPELDGCQIMRPDYELAQELKLHSYVLLFKGPRCGVLVDGERLLIEPVLSDEAAIELVKKCQRSDYLEDFIAYLEKEEYEIRMSFELPDREGEQIVYKSVSWEWEGLTMTNWVDEKMGLRRTMPSKDRLASVAEFVVGVLEDLGEQALADWVKGLMALIEAEKYQEFVEMIAEVTKRLAAVK